MTVDYRYCYTKAFKIAHARKTCLCYTLFAYIFLHQNLKSNILCGGGATCSWSSELSTSTKWKAFSQANKDYFTTGTMKWILMLCTSCKTSYKDSNPPVLAGNLPFSLNISGFPFSHNVLQVFETLTSQGKIMFSLFNQSFLAQFFAIFFVVSQPFLPFWLEHESVIGINRP